VKKLNNGNNKNAYYVNFNTAIFLGAKELLKSMPTFFNRVYFSSKYANALWSGDKEEYFSNITLLTEEANIEMLRNIIKNNFLYIKKWDSVVFTDKGDYGFSFVAGNVKFILLTFRETPEGYVIKSYDANTGDCYETNVSVDKKYFLDVSMKENGEIVRTCDFNLEYINDSNTKVERAPKKMGPTMVTFSPNSGHALTNLYIVLSVMLLCVVAVMFAYYLIKIRI
jgi:hypothetical protein